MGRSKVRVAAVLCFCFGLILSLAGSGLAEDRKTDEKTFEASAAHGVGTDYSSGFLVGAYSEGLLQVSVSGVSGTPNAKIVAETSYDNSTYFFHSNVASVNLTGATAFPLTNFGKYLRTKVVITGGDSSDTITYKIEGVFKN